MKKKLLVIGAVFLFIAVFLIATGLTTESAKAEDASGTWEGTCTRTTYGSIYYYDVVLELSGGSSASGTITLTCTDVQGSSEWVDTSAIGTVQTVDVYGTASGSELTLQMDIFTLTLEISGDMMTGDGQGVDVANTPSTWSFNLMRSGGFGGFPELSDISSLEIPSVAIAIVGGSCSIAASFLPGPSGIRGHKNRSPVFYRRAPAKQITYPARVSQPVQTQQSPQSSQQPQQLVRPPSADPNQTLNLPIQEELGPTNGDHLVPWDAPQQWRREVDPPGYPYAKGTSATVECQYCHCMTLSPFMSGWYCTNPLCPARREWVQKRSTHHKFNKMTWRRL